LFLKRKVFSSSAFDFNKRPEVIVLEDKKKPVDDEPRYLPFFNEIPENSQTPVPVLIPYEKYNDLPNVFPVFTIGQLVLIQSFTKEKFLLITLHELSKSIEKLKNIRNLILIQKIETKGVSEEIDLFVSILEQSKMDNPVIFHKEYAEKELESLQVKVAMDFGRPFVNGYGNGIFIVNTGKKVSVDEVKSLSFSVLQASRALITKTEYIACPSCGRTLFDLETTTQKIRNKTGHLKGLKIAIMGCIVNGVGEMADADYGYVGGSPGKITLYKNKKVVKKNIPENNAVDELITLIKQSGDWVEPINK
jgi:(E)-4-hydroxy-3-methylbut-2-enyl-diphosphate synthase